MFTSAFAFINVKVAKLTAIVAKNGSTMTHKKNTDLTGDLTGDIVAKNMCYCSKTDLVGDIIGDLAGAKKIILL
jgi:hypothetical protein